MKPQAAPTVERPMPQQGIVFTCDRHGEQGFNYFTFGGFALLCGCEWTHVPGQGLMRVMPEQSKAPLDTRRSKPLPVEGW